MLRIGTTRIILLFVVMALILSACGGGEGLAGDADYGKGDAGQIVIEPVTKTLEQRIWCEWLKVQALCPYTIQ